MNRKIKKLTCSFFSVGRHSKVSLVLLIHMNVKESVYGGDDGKNITMVETLIIKTKNWRRNRRG